MHVPMRVNPVRRKQYSASLVREGYFVVKHLERFLGPSLDRYVFNGCRVGDIGCGEQPLRTRIEDLGGVYAGIDISQNSVGTVDHVASATSVPLPNGCFDVIVCTEVIEHVLGTQAVFRELSRLLAPGGHLILTTPFSYPLHEIPHDYVRLTPFLVQECARQNALDVVTMDRSGNEVEVIATVWDTLWRGMFGQRLGAFSVVWVALMRSVMNVTAQGVSALFGRLLPCKYFLGTLCILQRQK